MRSRSISSLVIAACAAIGALSGCPSVEKKDGSTPAPSMQVPVVGQGHGKGIVNVSEDEIFIDADVDVAVGEEPLTVQFTAEPFDPDDVKNPSYLWEFGDGATSKEPNTKHTYTKPGDYEAKITISEGKKSGSDTFDITVVPKKKK